jgi:DNA invertase Pin-like site-specific DNA recombinase
MNGNNKAIAILRVSTKRQEEGVSHALQAEQINEWVEKHGLNMVVAPFKIAESAKDTENRKQYHRAIDYALNNKIRHILFYMGDREARNLTENEYNEKLVRQDRIVLHYVREDKILYKNSSESDFTARDYQAVGNKDFSRRLSVKVNDAMRKKAENGWFPNNHAPKGYIHEYEKDSNGRPRKRGTIIVKDPDDRVVKMVIREFELCAQGYSVTAIRKQIIDEGFIAPSAFKKYSPHGIEARLKNKFYRGKFDWQGIVYEGKHEIIIPKSILTAVDSRFGHKKIRRKESAEKGIFSGGWLRCGHPECGLQITCEQTKKKIKETGELKEFRYYRCSNSRGVHESQRGSYVSEGDLLAKFEKVVERVQISKSFAAQISQALNDANATAKEAISREMQGFRDALKKLHEQQSRFLDLLARDVITDDECRMKLDEIERDRKHFTNLLEESQYKISDAWKMTSEMVLELAKNAKTLWNEGTLEEKLAIAKKLCWNPVLEGANLRYDLRKPFATISEMSEKEDWRSQGDSNPCILRERGKRLRLINN